MRLIRNQIVVVPKYVMVTYLHQFQEIKLVIWSFFRDAVWAAYFDTTASEEL